MALEQSGKPHPPGRRNMLDRLAELARFKFERIDHDRFQIRQVIGSGAMSNVFMAHDHETGSETALKVAKGNRPSRIAIRREAGYLSSLSHPAIVSISCSGTICGGGMDGLEFISMEFVGGPTLAARLSGGARMGQDEALELVLGLCSALAHVHANGIVHRDVKPENILLPNGSPKLIDFGVSEPMRRGILDMARLRFHPGDLCYAAPELYGGHIDQRTDVFSLGALLYRMLSGKELDPLRHRMSGEAPLEEIPGPAASKGMLRAVSKALELEKSARFGSAEEMADAIRRS